MKTTAGVLFALSLFLSGCVPVDLATFTSPLDESADGNVGAWWTSKPDPPKNLFADKDLAPATGTLLSPSEIVSMFSASVPIDTLDVTPPATFTYQGNGSPRYWSGAITLAAAPVNLLGAFYDFSKVASIRFLIKTAIDPARLAVHAQAGTKGSGQNSLTLATLSPGTDLTKWTLIRVPVNQLFLADANLKKVRSVGILWGSAIFDTTLAAGSSFQIGEIAFEDELGEQVPFGSLLSVAESPTTLPPVPTLPASSVSSLHTSSGTYNDIAISDWNADWLQNGYLSTTIIANKTVKVLNLSDYQGINITNSGSLSGATLSLLNLNGGKTKLHLSYWSSGGGMLNVDFLNGPTNGVVADSWVSTLITSQQWINVDFDLPADVKNGNTILSQLKFTNELVAGSNTFDTVKKVLYLDNIYFH